MNFLTAPPKVRFSVSKYAMALLTAIFLSLSSVSVLHATVDDLAYYLPPGEVHWLGTDGNNAEAAVDETDSAETDSAETEGAENQRAAAQPRVLLLQRESTQPYERGKLLFVPEFANHPLQSTAVRTWYQGMAEYGWFSYALQSPTTSVNELIWQENTDARYPDPAEITPLLSAMRERLQLAIEHIQVQPGPVIVVAEGVSAAVITQLLDNGEFPQVDALVVYAMYFPQWQLNETLATAVAQLRIPVLELVPGQSHSWVSDASAKRRQQAQRHQHPSFRQRTMPAGRHAEQPRYMLHELYGWLRSEDF